MSKEKKPSLGLEEGRFAVDERLKSAIFFLEKGLISKQEISGMIPRKKQSISVSGSATVVQLGLPCLGELRAMDFKEGSKNFNAFNRDL